MAVQLITYDLRRPGQNYAGLFEAIKALGACCHPLESVWLVKSALSISEIGDSLRRYLDANDSLLVIGLNGSWATVGLGKDSSNWLAANVSR